MFDHLHRRLIDLGVVFIAAIAVLSFVQIVCRYVFEMSLPWSNDLTQVLMMWMVMTSAGAMLWRGSHFALGLVTEGLPDRVKKILRVLNALLIAAFAVFLMITGARLAQSQANQMVPALGITYLYVYLAMPVGAFFIFLFAIGGVWRELRTRGNSGAAEKTS